MRSLLLPFLLVLVSLPAQAQDEPLDRQNTIEAARGLMSTIEFATLITLGSDGHPQARVVDAFDPDPEMAVWIGTNPRTRKVAEIAADPRVTLSYVEPGGSGYVTIIGRAEIISDPALRTSYFKPGWNSFYPSGPTGEDFVLIRVTPVRLEIVSYGDDLVGDPVTWKPPIVEFP